MSDVEIELDEIITFAVEIAVEETARFLDMRIFNGDRVPLVETIIQRFVAEVKKDPSILERVVS